jgi:hypothetical protein
MFAVACRWLVCALLLCAIAQVGSVAAGRQAEEARKSVVLTSQQLLGAFPVTPEILVSKPPVLFVSIAKVVNPERIGLEIFVYLSRTTKDNVKGQRTLVGNFSLYPPDKPGGFQLSTADAFRKLKTGKSERGEVNVVVEMRRMHETGALTPIEVTVSAPEWRSKPK